MDVNLAERGRDTLGPPSLQCADIELCTRTSWADASVAYKQIKKGKASGNVRALWLRWCLQAHLYNLGLMIERHAGKVLFLGLQLLSLCCIGLKTASMESDLEKLWVEEGGRLSRELTYTRDVLGERSGNSLEMILQTGRAGSTDIDLLTVESLMTHYETVKAATSVTVDLFDITWKLRDICYAANFPNIDDNSLINRILEKLEPCVIITPLDCFWEASQFLGPDYGTFVPAIGHDVKWSNLDPIDMVRSIPSLQSRRDIEVVLHRAGIGSAYQEKPCLDPTHPECPVTASNFRSKKVPDIGEVLTGGCSGFAARFLHWEEELIVGGAHHTKSGKLSRVSALQSIIQLMGEQDLYDFHKETYKVYGREWSPERAKLIIDTWQRKFTQEMQLLQKTRQNDSMYQISSHSSASLTDLMNEYSNISHIRLIIATLIILMYMSVRMGRVRECVESRAWVGVVSVFVLSLSVTAALGVCAVMGIKFNAVTTQIIPFLGLGVGVDDVFHITQTLSQVSNHCNKHLHQSKGLGRETGECLKRVGISVVVKSVCSGSAFLLAAIIPLPAMRAFSIQCAVIMFFNMATMLFVYPAILSIDLRRQRNGRLDIFCCIKSRRHYDSDNTRVLYREPPRCETTSLGGSSSSSFPDSSESVRSCGARLAQQHDVIYSSDVTPCRQVLVHTELDGSKPVTCLSSDSAYLTHSASSSSLSSSSSSLASSRSSLSCQYSDTDSADVSIRRSAVSRSSHSFAGSADDSCSRSCCILRLFNRLSDWSLARFSRDYYSPFLLKKPIKVVVIVTFLAALAASVVGLLRVKDGLEITELIPRRSSQSSFFQQQSAYFGLYNIYAVTEKNFDYTSARGQSLIHSYSNAFLELDYVVKEVDGVPTKAWLQLFRAWLQDIQKAYEKDFSSGLISEEGCRHNNCTADARLGYKLIVQTGDIHNPIDKKRVYKGRLVDDKGVIYPPAFYTYLTAWTSNDALAYGACQANLHPRPKEWLHSVRDDSLNIPKSQPLQFAQVALFLHGLSSTDQIVSVVKEIRGICDGFSARGLPNYPHGPVFTFWEQYINLRFYLLMALVLVLVVIFVLLSATLVNPWAAILIVFVISMTMLELFGAMGLMDIRLSAVPAVLLIIAAGLGLEYTFHLTYAFITSIGSRDRRTHIALEQVLSPVTHSSVTTLLSLVMLVQAEFIFIIKYFLFVLTLLIIISVLNGLVLLPVLLSLIGPNAEVIPVDKSDRLELPPPETREPKPRRHSSRPRFPVGYGRRRSGSRSRRSRRNAPLQSEPMNNLSTIAEESSQYSTPSVSIEVLPEVVVNTTVPMTTQTTTSLVDERCRCEVEGGRTRERPPPGPSRANRSEASTRRGGSRSHRTSLTSGECPRRLVTTVEATARVKVQVHTPIQGDVSRTDYKSRRRKPTTTTTTTTECKDHSLSVIKDLPACDTT